MIDLHSHVLPEIDDGASSIDEALQMIRKAINHGVSTIVATPHLFPQRYTAPTKFCDEILEKLNSEIEKENLPIRVVLGRECFLSPEIFKYEKDLTKLTIDRNGKYILVETSMHRFSETFDQLLIDLQVDGFVPIIAHPERYLPIVRDPNRVLKYIEMGCLTQLNLGSLLKRYGRKIAETAHILIEHHAIHVVASDMHSPSSIMLGEGLDLLCHLVGQSEAKMMVSTRPQAIIDGRSIERPTPLTYHREPTFRNLWGMINS